jgi:hypothetical protein
MPSFVLFVVINDSNAHDFLSDTFITVIYTVLLVSSIIPTYTGFNPQSATMAIKSDRSFCQQKRSRWVVPKRKGLGQDLRLTCAA